MNDQVVNGLERLENLRGADTAVALFHGYGASMHDLYGISQVVKADADWFFPDAPLSVPVGPHMLGKAWFPIDMSELEAAMMRGEHRDFSERKSEDFENSYALALEFLKDLRSRYKTLVVGGFSQGAMLASHLFAPANADGLILYSGVLADKAGLERRLEQAKELEFLQSHGSSDPVLSHQHARDLFDLLQSKNLRGEFVSFPGGHEISPIVLEKTAAYLEKVKRQ